MITVKNLAWVGLLLLPLQFLGQTQLNQLPESAPVYAMVSQPAIEQLVKGMEEVDSFLDKMEMQMSELVRLNDQLTRENEQLNTRVASIQEQIEGLAEENDILFASSNADAIWNQEVIEGNRAHMITLEQQRIWCERQIEKNERQIRSHDDLLSEHQEQYRMQKEYRELWELLED